MSIKMRFTFLSVLLFCLLGNSEVSAVQKQLKPKDTIKIAPLKIIKDSGIIELRKFNDDSIARYSKQKEFIYDTIAPAKSSGWDKFWRWFWGKIEDIFSGSHSGPILKYLVIIIVICLVVFAVIKFLGVDLKMLTGKSKQILVPFSETLENIHEIDFEEQIDIALGNNNYRLAVRLLYLKTLKNLTDKELILWQLEKTNQAYVLELADEDYQKEFSALTNQFEYIWYGEFHIDKKAFEQIYQSFLKFNQGTK